MRGPLRHRAGVPETAPGTRTVKWLRAWKLLPFLPYGCLASFLTHSLPPGHRMHATQHLMTGSRGLSGLKCQRGAGSSRTPTVVWRVVPSDLARCWCLYPPPFHLPAYLPHPHLPAPPLPPIPHPSPHLFRQGLGPFWLLFLSQSQHPAQCTPPPQPPRKISKLFRGPSAR